MAPDASRITIEVGSPAFQELLDAITDPYCTHISVAVDPDGWLGVKKNEAMWSAPLSVRREQ